ncbi:MAG: PAQR family membrane homeostasis protein TrhA [Alkalispirochaetaceae bacterium]
MSASDRGNQLGRYHDPAAVNSAVEEIFSSLTHAIGVGLSIAGLVILLILTSRDPSPYKYISFTVYGVSQILLFSSSGLIHGFFAMPKLRYYLRIVDQAFVYLLIAGTYTPITLISMRGPWGWGIFVTVWTLALAGILLKTLVFKKKHIVTDLLYLPMGWIILFTFRPLLRMAPPGFVLWLLIGGACYTVGVIFYLWKRLPGSHVIWHLFVLGGNVSFYLGYALHVA